MRRVALSIAVGALVSASTVVWAQGFKKISELLTGYQEVPSVSTTGTGDFNARISNDGSRIDWELSYADLEGAVQQAHIHFGQKGVNGGISVFLCTNLGNGPAGTQPCPAPPATISGTILAADVSPNIPATAAARTQGINTGEIDELIKAIRAGATYVNVHSTTWPGGEIRSQINGNLHGALSFLFSMKALRPGYVLVNRCVLTTETVVDQHSQTFVIVTQQSVGARCASDLQRPLGSRKW